MSSNVTLGVCAAGEALLVESEIEGLDVPGGGSFCAGAEYPDRRPDSMAAMTSTISRIARFTRGIEEELFVESRNCRE